MTETRFSVTSVGNAIVDVIAQATDEFLAEENIIKGAMNLIDEDRAKHLYDRMGPATEVSGGSAGNTMAGFASFGGEGAFIGKVADDQLGKIFIHDMKAVGIHTECAILKDGPETARSFIFVTPDAQRSMNTFLGASVEFDEDDIKDEIIAASEIIYLEGYLFDKPQAKDAYKKASRIAHENGRKVALSLSDSFCVQRHHAEFLELVKNDCDILFANEDEITELFGTKDFDEAIKAVQGQCEIAAITRSAKGSVIVTADRIMTIEAQPVSNIEDTTGAGDQYAAGFLYGLSEGMPLEHCGYLGSLAASEVISHIGPRPLVNLSELAKEAA
jgi:sugar/nucleoside kinase (ribokinase family)